MPAPVQGSRRRPQRLDSLKDTNATYQSSPRTTPPPVQNKARQHTCCEAPDIQDRDSGGQECLNCGTEFNVESDLHQELTFAEGANGGFSVVGGFVGDHQRFANTMGGTVRGLQGMEGREKAHQRGKYVVDNLVAILNLRQQVADMAYSLYKLASINGFIQGRRVDNVAACCIYLADRKQNESTLLLMDLAEKIQVSVWVLGDTYKQFLAVIMDKDPGTIQSLHKIPQLEPLVLKFCRKLEFDADSHKVAEDACKLLKGMKRDWMVEGRQPAGIIGAAIILAARMNNFRRTVREVVYCVKVADSTINQRLYEFKRTKRSKMTLEQFKEFGAHYKQDDILPPAIYKRKEKEERKRKRALIAAGVEDASLDADVVARPSGSSKTGAKVTKKRKTAKGTAKPTASDAAENQRAATEDGFLVPDIPLNPAAAPQDAMDFESEAHLEYVATAAAPEEIVDDEDDDEEEPLPLPKRRGRPPKKRETIVIAPEDLEIEEEIENEVRENIRAWDSIFKEFNNNPDHPILRAAGDKAKALVDEHMPNANIRLTEEVGEDEFEDDEDVMNCVNNPEEVAMKERLWITQNEEWLREQQAKLLQKELDEARGKKAKPKRKRKRYQMGDGSVLDGQPAASAAEAVQKMIQKRAKFSSHIDYEKLQELFGSGQGGESSASGSGQGASPVDSGTGSQPAQPKEVIEVVEDGDQDAEGEYEEVDDEPETYVEEEFDDPGMYMSDEDVGFEDIPDDF
jgi:transcription factor IIIB subunit 2